MKSDCGKAEKMDIKGLWEETKSKVNLADLLTVDEEETDDLTEFEKLSEEEQDAPFLEMLKNIKVDEEPTGKYKLEIYFENDIKTETLSQIAKAIANTCNKDEQVNFAIYDKNGKAIIAPLTNKIEPMKFDELNPKCVETIKKIITTYPNPMSMLQRTFSIGYSKALKVVEEYKAKI